MIALQFGFIFFVGLAGGSKHPLDAILSDEHINLDPITAPTPGEYPFSTKAYVVEGPPAKRPAPIPNSEILHSWHITYPPETAGDIVSYNDVYVNFYEDWSKNDPKHPKPEDDYVLYYEESEYNPEEDSLEIDDTAAAPKKAAVKDEDEEEKKSDGSESDSHQSSRSDFRR